MTQLATPGEVKSSVQPPILDVLPAVLRREAAPGGCVCQRCAPHFSEVQRAAHERVQQDWQYIRIAWCDAHGYEFLDLIRAEWESAAFRV